MSASPRTQCLTERLATAITLARYEDLPASTRSAAKRAVLDGVGVMLAASGLSSDVRPFVAFARTHGSPGPAAILGFGDRVAAPMAALANGAMAHALDFEDTFDKATLHPNASLLPALVALAQARAPVSGREFITAVAIGCDVACRLGLSLRQPLETGGWYPPPILGAFGAVAAAARLLRLQPQQVADAFSLLLCQNSCAGEIRHAPDAVVRAVREAFPAQAAVTCALLAEGGVRGFDAPLEGTEGFFRLFAAGRYEPADLMEGLGERFWIEQLSFKKWPCCRGTHAYVEGLQTLRRRHGFGWRDVAAITLAGGDVQRMLCEPLDVKCRPRTLIDARFSAPFAAACALLHDEVTLDSFSADTLEDARLHELATLVRFEARPGWGRDRAAGGAVHLRLRDGTRLDCEIEHALGHPGRPLSDADLVEKFVAGAAHAARPCAESVAQRSAARLMELQESSDVGAELP